MWQYYVLMALLVAALVAGLASNNKPTTVKYLSTGQVIMSLVVGSLMTWLIWSFLSVNWMWLSIGLMALSFVNLARMTFYCAILRKTISDKTSYGTFICLVKGVSYTIFYFKYVV